MNPTGKLLLDPETLDFRDPKQRSQFCIDSGITPALVPHLCLQTRHALC